MSDHFDGKRFHNLERKKRQRFLDILKWQCTRETKKWPERVKNQAVPQLPSVIEDSQVFITQINHSTMVVQTRGLNLITDPVFSHRVSPFSWVGPKRVREPGLDLRALPKIDVVLVSHNHFDHMDLDSLRAIEERDQPVHITPLGNEKILKKADLKRVIELDWWEAYRFEDHLITLTPAHHWSQRHLFDYCKSLWGGFLIDSNDMKLFFAGDTGYSSHFQKIRDKLGKMDVSILPIGAYEPRWFMKDHHMDPNDAIIAHQELGSEFSVGMHFGTFQLTDEGIDDPVIHLKERLALHQIPEGTFIAPENGQTVSYVRASASDAISKGNARL